MRLAAGVTDNRTILQKADLSLNDLVTDGGYLEPAQAAKFVRLLIKQATLMKLVSVTPMAAPKQLIEKIRFGSRVLAPGLEGTALVEADRSAPDLSQVELDAKLVKAEVRLTDEVLEDSIERGDLKNTIMSLLTEAIARDVEELMVQGDESSPDSFLALLDGMLASATSNVVDVGVATINKGVFRDMLKAMPREFLRNKGRMAFITSTDAELDYRDALSDRATVVGDRFLEQEAPIKYSGIPIVESQLFPENLGTGTNETNVIFTDPKNIHLGVWRKIKLETERLARQGLLCVVATMRLDVKYEHEPAVVKAIKVKVGA